MRCDLDRVMRSLFTKLIPLTGEYDLADRASQRIADIPKGYHTGSSHYMWAESELESSESSINIQRMSLEPAGTAPIQSASQPTLRKMTPCGSGQLQSYLRPLWRNTNRIKLAFELQPPRFRQETICQMWKWNQLNRVTHNPMITTREIRDLEFKTATNGNYRDCVWWWSWYSTAPNVCDRGS